MVVALAFFNTVGWFWNKSGFKRSDKLPNRQKKKSNRQNGRLTGHQTPPKIMPAILRRTSKRPRPVEEDQLAPVRPPLPYLRDVNQDVHVQLCVRCERATSGFLSECPYLGYKVAHEVDHVGAVIYRDITLSGRSSLFDMVKTILCCFALRSRGPGPTLR